MIRSRSILDNDVAEILISEEEIDATVARIAAEIDRDYGKEGGKLHEGKAFGRNLHLRGVRQ